MPGEQPADRLRDDHVERGPKPVADRERRRMYELEDAAETPLRSAVPR